MIKKSKTLIFLIILISFLLLAGFVEANGKRSFQQIFEKLTEEFVKWATYLAAIAIGVCVILIASSAGDPKRLADAKRALVYVVIGLAIVQLGEGIKISATTTVQQGAADIAKNLGTVAAIAGAIFLGYGIFEFATSGGDPKKLDEAKTIILWSGIAVALGVAGSTGGFSSIITSTTPKSAAGQILNIFGAIAGAMGVISIGLGLFKFATSAGDPRTLAEAQTLLIWGGVGVVLGVFLTKEIDTILKLFGITW